MNLGLQDKVAIVMASSKGLGRASAIALSKEGVKVVIGARDKKTLLETAKFIEKESGRKALAVPVDVTNKKDLEKIIQAAVDEFGGIDILVNNAGGPKGGRFEDMTDEDWQRTFDLNFLSAVRMIRLVLPHMRASGNGRIINMVSISAKQPIENLILSNAIRAGVLGMAKTLSDEVAKDHITVNNILTGYFLTENLKKHYSKEKIQTIAAGIPMKRLGIPEEYGSLVAFLASEQASFITGTSIQIDGGHVRSLY